MELGKEIREGFASDLEREAARKIIRAIENWRQGGRIRTAQRRWVFELIQNALDVRKQRGGTTHLKIEVVAQDNRMMFKHNAGYFTAEEIRALVYAYSTKPYERESDLAGKFATGFLVTHIANERVDVRAILNRDSEFYEFGTLLDRKSNSIDVIFNNFSRSFEQLDHATRLQGDPGEYWTEYTYKIADNIGREAIHVGISEVKKCLPFLFAFSEVNQITINGEKFNKEPEREIGNHKILIEKVGSVHIWVRKSPNVDVAIVDSETNNIVNLSDTPRIYIKGLPLVETGDYLQIPFTIHSAEFETLVDRDTLTNTDQNSKILEEAFNLYQELVDCISEYPDKKMGKLYHLVDFRSVSDDIILQNPLWNGFNGAMKDALRKITQDIPLVETFEGRKEITGVVFPSKQVKLKDLGLEVFGEFYDLLRKIKDNIPVKDELESWVNLATKLNAEFADILNVVLYNVEDMKDEFVKFVSGTKTFPTFEDFGKKYGLADSKPFLLSLFKVIDDLYGQKIIESPKFVDYLLPDQTGCVGPLNWDEGKQLYIDNGIPNDFKLTADKIGWEIGQCLLDTDFATFEIVNEFVDDTMDVEKALEVLLDEYQPEGEIKAEAEWDDSLVGWIDLFLWCAVNKKLCKEFPIVTKGCTIKQLDDLDSETFLIPFAWMGVNGEYEDIYKETRLLHRRYFETDGPEELIQALRNFRVFVTNLPYHVTSLTFRHDKLKCILTEGADISKVDHKIGAVVSTVSTLPFWSDIIGEISADQQHAKLFFRFVVSYLINKDENWEKQLQVSCSCKDKSHKIIPCQWLASLKADAWVPFIIPEGENGEEKIVPREATKESIENLFRDGLEELIKSNPERICRLLPHISGFDELDLKIKLESIEKGKPEETVRKEVSMLVDIAKIVPDLSEIANRDIYAFQDAIAKLKQALDQQPVKEENKKIGKNLEKIIAKIMTSECFRVKPIYIRVKPIYRGGDLAIWSVEDEGWDCGLIEIEPYLMEIKFTSGARAHLSRPQSEMARSKKENYIVLVVDNVTLREQLKLEIDESTIPEKLVTDIIESSHVIREISSKLGSVPNPEEVEPDIHGYWVKRKLWGDKDNILKWIEQEFR